MPSSGDTTALLINSSAGDRAALDALLPRIYEDLRAIAHARLRGRSGETLNTTGLVHEAYLRLVDAKRIDVRGRSHFYALAARTMRFILVDHARERTAQKRGGGVRDVRIDGVEPLARDSSADDATTRAIDLLTVDSALSKLASFSSRLAELVEYRFFGGLTYEEIAEITGRSVPTVKRDWARARTWLFRAMRDGHLGPETNDATT